MNIDGKLSQFHQIFPYPSSTVACIKKLAEKHLCLKKSQTKFFVLAPQMFIKINVNALNASS